MSTEIINEEDSSWEDKRDDLETSVENIISSVNNLKICHYKVDDSLEDLKSTAQDVLDSEGNFEDTSNSLRISLENFGNSFMNNYEDMCEEQLRDYFTYDNGSVEDNDFPTDFPTLKAIVSESLRNIDYHLEFDNEVEIKQFARLLI